MLVVEGGLIGLVGFGVNGVDDGESIVGVPPRTAAALPVLPELKRLTRSRSTFSSDGVGEFR